MNPKKKSRCYDNLHTYIYQLLKYHNKDMQMTEECKDIINHLARDLAIRYINACVALCRHAKKITIESNAIIAITKLWVTEPTLLIDFAHDTWDNYSQNTVKGISKNHRAKLFLPPARFKTLFKEHRGVEQKIGEPAYIFLTAIIEFVISTIIVKTITLARNENKITINGVYLFQALNDHDNTFISQLFPNTFIAGFGWICNERLFSKQQEYLSHKE